MSQQTFKPPKKVQQNAAKALEIRRSKPDSQKGMTPVGIARARDLSNGKEVSLDTIKRMNNYFTRHAVDKKGSSWKDYGKGRQAWDGWGGDEGWAWAKEILKKYGKSKEETQIGKLLPLLKAIRESHENSTIIELPDSFVVNLRSLILEHKEKEMFIPEKKTVDLKKTKHTTAKNADVVKSVKKAITSYKDALDYLKDR